MSNVKYIVLCKASHEHFVFADTAELMTFLDADEHGNLHSEDYHADLRIFAINQEFVPVPRNQISRLMVKNWMLREKKASPKEDASDT